MITITKIGGEDIAKPMHYEKRQWVKCNRCGWVGYYDYTPYSLSNPIRTLGCPHDFRSAKNISEAEAVSAIHAFKS
jgi:hypothetical protein